MSTKKHDPGWVPKGTSSFATTRWSVVLAAKGHVLPEAREALAALCEATWYPLYAYVRRRGFSAADAQDLTQSFFAHLLEKQLLSGVDPSLGKFRSFLLACMRNFIANERDRESARKRGGGKALVSIDAGTAEERYAREPSDPVTPERFFERKWALTLLERALDRVRSAYAAGGRAEQFNRLQVYLTGAAGAPPHAELARQMGLTEDAVKAAVHRLRRRYRRELRAEIAQTVSSPQEVEEEIRDLFAALEN